MIIRSIVLFFLFLIFNNANAVIIDTKHQFIELADLKNIPQNADAVINNFDLNTQPKLNNLQFKKQFFAIWLNTTQTKKNIENILAISETHARKVIDNFHGLHYSSYSIKLKKQILNNLQYNNKIFRTAIITKNSDLRLLPIDLPFFNLEKPEEYYPFNANQNSRLVIGTPIIIVNFSKDNSKALVYSNEKSMGWIDIENLALINHTQINHYIQKKLLIITCDHSPLYDHKQRLSSYQDYGTILAINKKNDHYELLIPSTDHNYHVKWKHLYVNKHNVQILPMAFNKDNLTRVINELIDKPYGWGSLHGFRDCSALVRAYFYSFGIYLPRNSGLQVKTNLGKAIEIGHLNNETKLEIIKKEGIAFRTLLYMSGHIGVYLGFYNDQAVMLHAIWAHKIIENETEGRNIIGKSVISTLELGRELELTQDKTLILDKINKIIIF